MLKCPICDTFSPDEASKCDCGYSFEPPDKRVGGHSERTPHRQWISATRSLSGILQRASFGILGFSAFIGGYVILVNADSAIHEIEAFMVFLIGAVFLSGLGVIEAIDRLGRLERN